MDVRDINLPRDVRPARSFSINHVYQQCDKPGHDEKAALNISMLLFFIVLLLFIVLVVAVVIQHMYI